MKNIHIIPTDKPSRLHYYNYIDPLGLSKEYLQWKQGRNIHITSDEEIKEGENYIGEGFSGKNKFKWTESQVELYPNIKKDIIILTTDQDLIKDGVQAIDDEFLEWFVKNPSCGKVEVESFCKYGDNCPSQGAYDKQYLCNVIYKIVIPKEEPKQVGQVTEKGIIDTIGNCPNCGVEFHIHKNITEPKQETLEEAAKNHQKNTTGIALPKHTFIEGAKWQQERSYSQEEVYELLTKFHIVTDGTLKFQEQWFEQVKKK